MNEVFRYRTQAYILATAYGWWVTLSQYQAGEDDWINVLNLAATLYLTHNLHTSVWTDKHGSNA